MYAFIFYFLISDGIVFCVTQVLNYFSNSKEKHKSRFPLNDASGTWRGHQKKK